MAMQPAVCLNCGGKLLIDDVDLNGFAECDHCHTKYKVIDIITIDGLPTAKTLLMNADFAMRDNNYEKAVGFLNEVLSIKPNCHEAWWKLYVCNDYFNSYYGYQDKYGNSDIFTKAQIVNNNLEKYAARAIEYAPPQDAETYRNSIQGQLQFVESVRNGGYDKKVKGSSGCYIATAVYGSYSCNEVIVLRRFRDEILDKYFFGRAFIKFYYAVSPYLAKKIKQDGIIGKKIRKLLDRIVLKLSR